MPKMSTDLILSGPTMGTHWSATLPHADFDVPALRTALQDAVAEVDTIASTWRPASDLMRLNAAALGAWVALPPRLMAILHAAVTMGAETAGAFDIGLGDAVNAWGFGPDTADQARVHAARQRQRVAAHRGLELDIAANRARKHHAMQLDLSGIAKGYGVDRLAGTLLDHGVTSGFVALDGEVRALGSRPDGSLWTVAVERPQHATRSAHSVLQIADAAMATSGDYRHWVQVGTRLLSHTINPATGAPLLNAPASVTVLGESCMWADAMATALMVMGAGPGSQFAKARGIHALFLQRQGDLITALPVGIAFTGHADVTA